MSWSPLRSLYLAILASLICFVVSSFFVSRWAGQIDEAAWSIAGNGGPSVVQLSRAREDIRKIERRVAAAQPSTLAADRMAVAVLRADFDQALVEYRKTPDYPGELEAWLHMHDLCYPFFEAAEGVLDGVTEGGPARAEATARMGAASDTLVASTVALVDINARGVERDAATIAALRRRAFWLTYARDALAFFFVIAGSLLSLRGARQSAALAAARHRRDAERIEEMEMFSGRVAHDLRDPLAAVVMKCSRSARLDTLAQARETLDRISATRPGAWAGPSTRSWPSRGPPPGPRRGAAARWRPSSTSSAPSSSPSRPRSTP